MKHLLTLDGLSRADIEAMLALAEAAPAPLLLGKGAALCDLSGLRVTGHWTGSRLSGLKVGRDESGAWHLSGLGSKGFLLGPLLARELAGQLLSARE